MLAPQYVYRAIVTDVYDGDSVTVAIDLGFYVHLSAMKIRLAGIDAPEVRGEEKPAGIASRDALRRLVHEKRVVIQTDRDKTGKYGRWIGTIWLGDVNVNEWMVEQGYATRYPE